MQRSISYKNPLTPFIYVAIFLIYSALSGVYLFLPPLLAVLYTLFSKAIKKDNTLYIILVSLCLVIFEAENGYIVFSTIIYFLIMYRYIIPKISKNFSCLSCTKISIVIFVYLGFYVFNYLLSYIFLIPESNISYYIIYYIVTEFFIVSIL